jgi:hypothetical protein
MDDIFVVALVLLIVYLALVGLGIVAPPVVVGGT